MTEQIKVTIEVPGNAPETFTMPEETPSSILEEEVSTYRASYVGGYHFNIRLSRHKPKEKKTS